MFQSARFTLTAWYLSIIILVTVIFSAVIYGVVSHQIEGLIRMQNDRIKRFEFKPANELMPPPNSPPMISTQDLQMQERQLLYTLIFIDLGIFILAGAAGYFLAGRTLHPIKIMIDEQNQFVSNASHELRTPIATLRAEMEGSLLEKTISDSQARKLISSNLEELGTLQNLSNNLLRLAQGYDPSRNGCQKIVSLPQVIHLAHKKVAVLAKKKNIRVVTKLEDVSIKGDADTVVELFVILLDNAIKYSGKNTTVTVVMEKVSEKALITVSDEGIGIGEQDLPHIFKRFYRADKSRSQVEGYGLGLSIVKKEVENYHGTIGVSSKPGQGTVFTLQFPICSSTE